MKQPLSFFFLFCLSFSSSLPPFLLPRFSIIASGPLPFANAGILEGSFTSRETKDDDDDDEEKEHRDHPINMITISRIGASCVSSYRKH